MYTNDLRQLIWWKIHSLVKIKFNLYIYIDSLRILRSNWKQELKETKRRKKRSKQNQKIHSIFLHLFYEFFPQYSFSVDSPYIKTYIYIYRDELIISSIFSPPPRTYKIALTLSRLNPRTQTRPSFARHSPISTPSPVPYPPLDEEAPFTNEDERVIARCGTFGYPRLGLPATKIPDMDVWLSPRSKKEEEEEDKSAAVHGDR